MKAWPRKRNLEGKKKKSKLKIQMTRDKAITDKTTPQKLGQVTASLPPGLCG